MPPRLLAEAFVVPGPVRSCAVALASLCSAVLVATSAHATTVTVQSTDSIWNYATVVGSEVAGAGSTTPTLTAITPGAGQVLTFSSVTGQLSLTPGYTYGPDGGISSPPGAYPMTISAAAGLSGIVTTHAAFLAGVFLNGQEAAAGHVAPPTLSFDSFSFGTLAPLDDQVFFIGDGLTGTGSGTTQSFAVPSDATELVLAITDAYGYSGVPGAYFDNSGSFTATFSIAAPPVATPEPATWCLIAAAVAGLGVTRRRKPALTLSHG